MLLCSVQTSNKQAQQTPFIYDSTAIDSRKSPRGREHHQQQEPWEQRITHLPGAATAHTVAEIATSGVPDALRGHHWRALTAAAVAGNPGGGAFESGGGLRSLPEVPAPGPALGPARSALPAGQLGQPGKLLQTPAVSPTAMLNKVSNLC